MTDLTTVIDSRLNAQAAAIRENRDNVDKLKDRIIDGPARTQH